MASITKVCKVLIRRAVVLPKSTSRQLTILHPHLPAVSCTHSDVVLGDRLLPVTVRGYATAIPKTNLEEIRSRVMECVGDCPKVPMDDKMTVNTHFMNDLGMDRDDQMEIIMAIEDRFGFQIPTDEANKLLTPKDIVEYIMGKKDVADYDYTSNPQP